MPVTPDTLTQRAEQLDATYATWSAKRQQALYTPEGAPIYSEDQHQQRDQALLAELETSLAAAESLASQALQEAETAVALSHADPADRLTAAELERVNQRLALAEADFERLPLPQLAQRCQAIAAAQDRAMAYLAWRFGSSRLATAEQQLRETGRQASAAEADALRAISAVVQTLAQRLGYDPAAARKASDATREHALVLKSRVRQARSKATGEAARLRQEQQLIVAAFL